MSSPISGFPIYIPPADYTAGPLAAASTTTTSTDSTSSTNDISLSDFFKTSSKATLDLGQTLHDIQFTDSTLQDRYFHDFLGQIDSLAQLFNKLVDTFKSFKFNIPQTDPGTASVNNQANIANPDISTVQLRAADLNTATDDYNTEADDFNSQYSAGFPNAAARDAAITQYNAAVTNYNNAATAYNNAVATANNDITNYNAEVDNYNATVLPTTNADIDNANISRQANGYSTLPHQDPFPDIAFIATATTFATLPYADPVAPVPNATPVPIPPLITIFTLPSDLNLVDDFIKPAYTSLAASAFFYVEFVHSQVDPIDKKKVPPDPGTQSITRPASIDERRDAHVISASGGVAGVGLAGLAMGLDHSHLSSIIADGLVTQFFNNFNLDTSNPLIQKIRPFILSVFVQGALIGALPGANSNLSANLDLAQEQLTPASRVANSIGAVSSVLGLLGKDGLRQTIDTLVNSTNLKKLSDDDKEKLKAGLTALASTSLLKLGLGSLTRETLTPGLVTKTIDAALIQGTPQNAINHFATVKTSLDDLKNTVGASSLADLLAQFLNITVTNNKNVQRPLAPVISQNVAKAVATSASPENPGALEQLIRDEVAKGLGNNANPTTVENLTKALATQTSIFAIAGSTRADLLKNLIPQVGPLAAEGLTDQATIKLFGFSPSFSQGALIEAPVGQTGLTAVNSLADSAQTLHKSDNKQFTDAVDNNFRNAHQDIHDLDAFLREVIDPGQTLIGLMYEGRKGNAFKRGQTDIQVA